MTCRVCWLGASHGSTRVATWNGRRDAWAAHIVAQSGIEFLIMPEPVGIQLKWDRRDMKDRYPKTPEGDYLYEFSPDRNAGWYDPTALAAIISMHANVSQLLFPANPKAQEGGINCDIVMGLCFKLVWPLVC